MAAQPSLNKRTKELRGQASSLADCDRLGSLLVKSFDLLSHLQKETLAHADLEFGLQSLEAECDLVKRHDRIPTTPLRSMVYGIIETLHGTIQSMKDGGRIRLAEREEEDDEGDANSSSSGVGETHSRESTSQSSSMDRILAENATPSDAAVAAAHSPPLNIVAAFTAAAAATATTKKARGSMKMPLSSPSISRVPEGIRPRRSGVKPAGYWTREKSRSISPADDADIPSTSAAAAVTPALLPVPSATGNDEFPLFSSTGEVEVKQEPASEGEEMELNNGDLDGEIDLVTHNGDARGVKRKKAKGCFSDIEDERENEEEEREEKLPRSALSTLTTLHQLLSTPSTVSPSTPTVSGMPSGSFSTGINPESGVKYFRCEICQKNFKHFHNLKSHIRSHTGDRRFGCERCGMKFMRLEHLQRHQKGQKCGTLPHHCLICGKRFAEEEMLRDHMILHEHQQRSKADQSEEGEGKKQFEKNEKGEYECPHCSHSFKYHCHIERHMRTHTGDRPFKCEECGKGFVQMTAYVQHKRVHSGSLPFVCSHCDHGFRTLGSLNVHLRMKHGEMLYVCQMCGEKFEKPTDLKEHRLAHAETKLGVSFLP